MVEDGAIQKEDIDDDEKYPAVEVSENFIEQRERSDFMMTRLELLNIIKHPQYSFPEGRR